MLQRQHHHHQLGWRQRRPYVIDRMPNYYGLPVDILVVWTRRDSNFCVCLATKQIAPLETLTCKLEYELLFMYLSCGIGCCHSPQKDLQFGRLYHQKWRNCYSIVICERSVALGIANHHTKKTAFTRRFFWSAGLRVFEHGASFYRREHAGRPYYKKGI